jgi:uncharacterized membrane protein
VSVAVLDDGLEWKHPDLRANCFPLSSGMHFDFNGNDPDPAPGRGNEHGTAVAGVLASPSNTLGGLGVAPEAKLVGLRLTADATDGETEARAFAWKNASLSVYNNSWGPTDDGMTVEGPEPIARDAITAATKFGRSGRGSIFVWACGNGRADGDESNYDGYSNMRETIAVGAVGDQGRLSGESESGANVVVVAPSSSAGRQGIVCADLVGAMTNCPIINYTSGQLTTDNLVAVKSVTEIPLLPPSNATVAYLTLTAVSSNSSLLKASINGTQLRLQSAGTGVGEAVVTITATDPDQQKTSLQLTVPVVNPSAPTVSITAPDGIAAESAGDTALLRISRSGSTASPLTVSLLSNGTATKGVDVQAIPATVTIPAGKSSLDVSIIPIADGKAEGRENLVFRVPPTQNQQPGTPATTTIDILDKEVPALSWTPITSTATEGGDPAKIRLSRTGPTTAPLTVPLSFGGASPAKLGLSNLNSATIPAGSASAEIRLAVPNNADQTGTQSLSVAIGSTALANTPANPVEILVHDNDVPTISLEAVDGTASEPGKDKASVRVRRTGATAAPLTIYLSISGSALAGVDYFSLPASVTIPAGGDSAFLDLVAKDDSLKEGQETVNLVVDRSIYYNTPAGSLRLVINDND